MVKTVAYIIARVLVVVGTIWLIRSEGTLLIDRTVEISAVLETLFAAIALLVLGLFLLSEISKRQYYGEVKDRLHRLEEVVRKEQK